MESLSKVCSYKNIINTEIMASKPKVTLIVEGIDDLKKFNLIKRSQELLNKNIKVRSIGSLAIFNNEDEEIFEQHIKNKKSLESFYGKTGALPVMNFIKKVESHHGIDKCKGYILGIVDRDSICYKRKENKENSLLYVLDYYSLESYYINKEVVEKTLYEIVSDPDLINENIVDDLYNQSLEESIKKLYYISLEALKKSCQSDYDSITGYKPDSINNFLNDVRLLNKIEELELFAQENNYNKNMALEIIKGKWFISTFCDIYFTKIKELKTLCNDGTIVQCDNCAIDEISEPCLYKPKNSKLNAHGLEEKFYALVDLNSLTPIKERIKQLK